MVEKRLKMDKSFSIFEIQDFEMLISFWLSSLVLPCTEGLAFL